MDGDNGAYSFSGGVAVDLRTVSGMNDFVLTPNRTTRHVTLFGIRPLIEKPRFFLNNALGPREALSALEAGDGYELDLPVRLPPGVYPFHLVGTRQRVVKAPVLQ